ncbi:hypothetical protein HZY97_19745 [Sphingomonas sp. R-74633]|uniref:hypothetical protein n=1 Tax=Sphingomonas sp. R-74633 TaxID=2751188 RepID=UPI0015D2B1F3|nr:hypothetical protein [Sphingomonas sp. R-74633]NYT43017.1 hypothetical protein [Sphingomonas sp. R-74633]
MSGRWRTLALILVALGVVAWAIAQWPRTAPQNALTDPASVERELLADEPGGALSRTIKRTFPEDFEALKAAVVERARAGGGPAEVQETAGAFVSAATQRRRASIVQAPVPALRAYLAAEIALAEQLSTTSPERCAAYFADPANDAGWYAPDLRALYLRQNIALWEAAAAARDHPAGRTIGPPAPKPVSCSEGLDARKAVAALPDAQFGQAYPPML